MEHWKDIKGYEGYYQISNLGRVKSLARTKKGKRNGVLPVPERILKTDLTIKGENYKSVRVTLTKNGRVKHYSLNVLVAQAFPEICGKWFEGAVVHHINENPLDNRAENLIVLSTKAHVDEHRGRFAGEKNPFYGKKQKKESIDSAIEKNSIPILQYTLDGVFVKEWKSQIVAARSFKKDNATAINAVLKGKKPTAYGFIWRYKD